VRTEAGGVTVLSAELDGFAELVARRVVELLEEHAQLPTGSRQPAPPLVDAQTLAEVLGISRSTVYDRASELGAVEVGGGSKPRLRFDVETARAALNRRSVRHAGERSQAPEPPADLAVRRRRRRTGSATGADLLPVRARRTAPGGDAA
jgi:hypothetical protein